MLQDFFYQQIDQVRPMKQGGLPCRLPLCSQYRLCTGLKDHLPTRWFTTPGRRFQDLTSGVSILTDLCKNGTALNGPCNYIVYTLTSWNDDMGTHRGPKYMQYTHPKPQTLNPKPCTLTPCYTHNYMDPSGFAGMVPGHQPARLQRSGSFLLPYAV